MQLPARIFDLHTHLFNARYVPLASVIAHAMGRDASALARQVARLLQALTGSAYADVPVEAVFSQAAGDTLELECLEHIWHMVEYELLLGTGSLDAVEQGALPQLEQSLAAPVFDRLRASQLMDILLTLDQIDYAAEGWPGPRSPEAQETPETPAQQNPEMAASFSTFLHWAERVVRKALWVVTRLMDPRAWGEVVNYPAFFLTLLHSEEQLLQKLFAGYGAGLPPLQAAHSLLDMQMAFPGQEAPFYPLQPVQEDRMQALQRAHPARIFGFSAFDPRREDWHARALHSLGKGFAGFKFYPAMGFKPQGNDPAIQARVDAFFDFCIARDLPVFAHCTPMGFQTRLRLGAYAHPRHWRALLEQPRWHALRLCLGHAGGGQLRNGPLHSPGWLARSDEEWQHEDNFARIVSELCTTYPRVYCEVGSLTELLQGDGLARFEANLQRARQAAKAAGRPFELLDKMAYGSDWHMPEVVTRTRRYLDLFLALMNRPGYAAYREAFFWKNAYRYLRLPM
ncbi:amidohydrolase family protein [Pantoea sp. 18069]|uniref:amidohydrolase family protein n=1 Tax=Pantoea sp. 18069 TaxID=2681415 RepID=UPI00135BE3DF|nr:amidohydrolase family protein [Pantoea sp. 18069]